MLQTRITHRLTLATLIRGRHIVAAAQMVDDHVLAGEGQHRAPAAGRQRLQVVAQVRVRGACAAAHAARGKAAREDAARHHGEGQPCGDCPLHDGVGRLVRVRVRVRVGVGVRVRVRVRVRVTVRVRIKIICIMIREVS